MTDTTIPNALERQPPGDAHSPDGGKVGDVPLAGVNRYYARAHTLTELADELDGWATYLEADDPNAPGHLRRIAKELRSPWRPVEECESASVFHRFETKMPDPTIPELLARLRELHEKATPGPWSTNLRGGGISARIRGHEVQVALACSQGAIWDERDDAAAIMRANAELIAELRSSLPAIIDALDQLTELYDVTQARLEAFPIPPSDERRG